MNRIFFGLTRFERALLEQTQLPHRTYTQLTRASSSLAPSATHGFFQKIFIKSTSIAPRIASYQPPRYFARGALEKDKRRNPRPFFYLLTETDEKLRPRPLPNNRKLLRSLRRGQGELRQNSQGHVYLDVDNQFILTLLPYLSTQGLSRPPYFNLFSSPEGAHIPIIPAREAHFQDIGPIREAGQTFAFEIEGFYSVEPSDWPEVEQIWFFKVRCPELEQLRRQYFLPALPGGHPFVMATAVQPGQSRQAALPTLRISPAAYAA